MIINQYKKESEKKEKSTTSTYDKNNYFNILLPEGVNELNKVIRIIPSKDETVNPTFDVSHIHNYKVDGKFNKLLCPQHSNNEPCPLCETKKELYELANAGDNDAKEAAKKYNTSKYYNVKVIDRDDENHGIKLFRFGHSNDKKGIFDKIVDLIENYAKSNLDILDPINGYDLNLVIKRDSKGYPIVSSVLPKPLPTKLVEDENKLQQLIDDTRTWKDFYGVKSYDYLNLVAQGFVPVYDKDSKTFVAKDSLKANDKQGAKPDPESIIKGTANVQKVEAPVTDKVVQQPNVIVEEEEHFHQIEDEEEDEDDDLPF